MSVLLDIDPLTGAIETMHYDTLTKGLTITHTQNVDAILDANQAKYNDSSQPWRGDDNDFWHVARVPVAVLQGWLIEFNSVRGQGDHLQSIYSKSDEWESFVWMRLNSAEYRKLRTAPVRV